MKGEVVESQGRGRDPKVSWRGAFLGGSWATPCSVAWRLRLRCSGVLVDALMEVGAGGVGAGRVWKRQVGRGRVKSP